MNCVFRGGKDKEGFFKEKIELGVEVRGFLRLIGGDGVGKKEAEEEILSKGIRKR